jgi:hypothetical protein
MEKTKMKRIEMQKLDVTPYVGTKAQIVKAELIETKFGKAIKLETNTIDLKEGDTLPEGQQLRASMILGLIEDSEGDLSIGIDSKTDKFCKTHKVNMESIPNELAVGDLIKAFEGIYVVCQKNKNGYLEIA